MLRDVASAWIRKASPSEERFKEVLPYFEAMLSLGEK